MKPKHKTLKRMVQKPKISEKVKKHLHKFDWGANGMSHRYKQLRNDRYDAFSLLQELVNESNYDWRVDTSQSHLAKALKTNTDSLNFDLLSLDRLGLIQIDISQLAAHHDHFSCKLIPHKIF